MDQPHDDMDNLHKKLIENIHQDRSPNAEEIGEIKKSLLGNMLSGNNFFSLAKKNIDKE